MQAFKVLGLLGTEGFRLSAPKSWFALMAELTGGASSSSPDDVKSLLTLVLERSGTVADVPAAVGALEWLGMLSDTPTRGGAPIDALCSLLEHRLQYAPGERDMVAMFHTVTGTFADSVEHHTSRLLEFGDTSRSGDSAMSKTVGYTTGAAAELLLGLQSKAVGDGGLSGGVVIPTHKGVYEPLLRRLTDFGLSWTESVDVRRR